MRRLRGELVVLFAIVFAMTVKPTGDDPWTVIVATAVAVALAALFYVRSTRAAPAAAAAESV